jgi:hypothetical protein
VSRLLVRKKPLLEKTSTAERFGLPLTASGVTVDGLAARDASSAAGHTGSAVIGVARPCADLFISPILKTCELGGSGARRFIGGLIARVATNRAYSTRQERKGDE